MLKIFKRPFYKFVSYVLNSQYFREELWHASKDLFVQRAGDLTLRYYPNPYKEGFLPANLPRITNINDSIDKHSPVFITTRFRSGSTFLWFLFRNIKDITAYYEPLNENRWFLDKTDKVDRTHLGVDNYAEEYSGLAYLDKYFSTDWGYKYLYMTRRHYDNKLYQYLTELINRSTGRSVLQFNRIDLRLDWIKAYFPDVVLLHMYRNPREQWMSIQIDGGVVPVNYSIVCEDTLALFYTLAWARDLRHVFDFLELEGKHPYELHYYLWRLSYIWARNYVHYSFPYEELVKNFRDTLGDLFKFIRIPCSKDMLTALERLNKGKITERWRDYASVDWFEEIENRCDIVLSKIFI